MVIFGGAATAAGGLEGFRRLGRLLNAVTGGQEPVGCCMIWSYVPKGAWAEMCAPQKLPATVEDLDVQTVAALLAERVADRVVDALMNAGFERHFAEELLKVLKKELEEG